MCRSSRSPRETRRREQPADGIAGRSSVARRLRRAVASAATDPAPLVVTGPPGSGRTFVARAIANADPLAPAPPVVVSELPADIDGLLLRPRQALIVCDVDVRSTVSELADLVARAAARGVHVIATCGDTEPMAGHLRMFGHRVDVPPLRDRRQDVPELASQLLAELAGNGRRPVLRAAAVQALLRHDWPGNVRELRSVLSVALAAAGSADIAVFHLPEEYRQAGASARWSVIELAERDAILRALSDHDGNKVAAASALGLARSTLYRKIRAFDIDVA
jgi:DNA-binding NtrC family response regulator